jgi:hypothetical protein
MSSSFLKKLQEQEAQKSMSFSILIVYSDAGSQNHEMKEESDEEGSEEEEVKDHIEQ